MHDIRAPLRSIMRDSTREDSEAPAGNESITIFIRRRRRFERRVFQYDSGRLPFHCMFMNAQLERSTGPGNAQRRRFFQTQFLAIDKTIEWMRDMNVVTQLGERVRQRARYISQATGLEV